MTQAPLSQAETVQKAADLLMQTLNRTIWRGHEENKDAFRHCFCVLAPALNPDCRVFEVLEALPHDNRKMDRTSFLNTLSNAGFYAQPAKTALRDIDRRLLPCLFMSENGHPFVVLQGEDETLLVHDGRKNETRAHQTLSDLKGEAWFFKPFDQNRQATSKFMRGGTGNSWFRALIGRFSETFMQIVVAGLALNIVALAAPLYMMAAYDKVISPSDIQSLPGIAIGVAIALITEYALRNNRSKALSWLSARLDNLVGNKIFSHLLNLPPDLVERASVAAQIARIKTFESVRDLFSGSIFLSFLEIPYVVIALGIIAVIAGPLVVVPCVMLAAYAGLFLYMRRKVKVVIRLAAKASSVRQQFTIETFEKIQGIRANGLSKTWEEKYDDLTGREIAMNFHLSWLGTIAETVAQAMTLMAAVATVGLGAHYIWTGEISTGALIATMMLVWRVLTPFYSLCAMIPRLEQLRNSVLQVNDLMDIETEQDVARSAARLPSIKGRITFAGTTLRYAAEADPVIAGLTLDVMPGSIIAIKGRNGSGKTSLLKIAKGMYRPQGGSVRVDGFDVRQLDPFSLRRHVAYVPQKPEFFSGSLRENVSMARPLATDQEVEQALMLADLQDDIKKLPQGIDTQLSPDNIPGGFAAKLSLARAYLHGGAILLVDELPGSLLNDKAGDNLRRYIEKSRGRRTVVMVTHKPEFQELADEVIELIKGEPPKRTPRKKPDAEESSWKEIA